VGDGGYRWRKGTDRLSEFRVSEIEADRSAEVTLEGYKFVGPVTAADSDELNDIGMNE